MAALDENQERPGRRRKGATAPPPDVPAAEAQTSMEVEAVEEARVATYQTREAVTIIQHPPHWADLPQAAPVEGAGQDVLPATTLAPVAPAPAGPESAEEDEAQAAAPPDGPTTEKPVGGRDARPTEKEE